MEERLTNSTKKLANDSPSKPTWQVWWRLLRPHTLTAAFVPVIIGTMLAIQDNPFHFGLFLAMMVASILIQSATNMFNEYYDFKRGLDHEGSVGIGGAIVRDGVRAETVLKLAFIFFGIAIFLGVYICLLTTWWIAVIGVVCMAAGYYYTGGPYPIAYTPFGEIAAGLFMGLILVLLSFYVQAEVITLDSVLLSLPISILVGGILMANNIRDRIGDQEKGRKTLAILLGHEKAVLSLEWMFIFSFLWIVIMIITIDASLWLLLVLLSLPKAFKAIKLFDGKTEAVQMMPAMKATAQMHTQFGLLMSIGLLLAYVI
ncbi:1,4-dihydroxy-2-naphthoate polyprenyltransferase [Guptibacillus algicola]|uniref:1,4-dihydroxy-2-naphthoate polyprenyltransferase n=1 Tax=Guptibacillus algicola TaxID=225844 RepID=UPI001CD5E312|nr:1,4-dihydroxy-2-naphthoate polyprenyltransferase [Alkalihalobacillus algicola]MCA0986457.1 1,4-dihydroxy-2-naphthoate polyprenyltransferase [Alkalihalobacillus algicola]